jgi:predicted nucleotidyltransferase
MNIHFTDKELFEKLKSATLVKVRVGSHLYGTNNENSDEDFLYIYATSENELKSFLWTNHQLQYKEEGVDHNFVSLHTFVRNIINGDSTINFEVVHSEELKGTWLGFLYELRIAFNTYTMMRSYNGFARRDCKHFSKAKTDYEKRKRFGHIVRGYIYAQMLMNNNFNFVDANDIFKRRLNSFTKITLDDVKLYAELLDIQRKDLNKLLEDKTVKLAKVMDVTNGMNLDVSMRLLQNTEEFNTKQYYLKDFDMSLFINAFENWVSYE